MQFSYQIYNDGFFIKEAFLECNSRLIVKAAATSANVGAYIFFFENVGRSLIKRASSKLLKFDL